MAGTPAGFNAQTIREGLLVAMNFGLPPLAADQPTFYFPKAATGVTAPVDDSGVPFDPSVRPTYTRAKVSVPCAIEYHDAAGKIENFGVIVPTKIRVILMGDEYEQVKGFDYVVIAGQRYFYRTTEPPVGLGSIPMWFIHCEAEDQG